MDDRSWIYQNSCKRLYRQDYLKRVEGFINFILFNWKNISEGKIRCSCMRCENKKFYLRDVVMIHLLKKGLLAL